MTEVQKYQGKFIQRQREQKESAKKDKVLERKEIKVEKAQKPESGEPQEAISTEEASKLRKLLKNETEFRGFAETAALLLKS